MDITVFPGKISGSLRAPASKSQAIRIISSAMLADGTSLIYHPSSCDDALAMLEIARNLGTLIKERPDGIEISGGFSNPNSLINCGESGLAARLMIPLASIFSNEMTVMGEGTLNQRHLGAIVEPMKALGVECVSHEGKLPFRIKGPLRGGNVEVDGSGGSQFVSGLLMALSLAKEDSELMVHHLKSIPYIDMTLEVLREFGIEIKHQDYKKFYIPGNQNYKTANMEVEGDWSGASFLMLAAALAGDLEISGLNASSRQADRQMISALQLAGVRLEERDSGLMVFKSQLKAFEFDATHCPDLFPPLAVLAAAADGISKINGLHRLSQKESNRGIVLMEELGKLGVNISLHDDQMKIHGGEISGGTIFSHNDHRIAMAGAVAALVACGPVTIQNAQCVSKSYPAFFSEMQKIGLKLS